MSQENTLLRPLFLDFDPIRCFRFWRRCYATRIVLAQLPDDRLAVIGLSPAARDREAARPFWDQRI